jgi:hypothetical protein
LPGDSEEFTQEEEPDEPNRIEVLDFLSYPFTFTWFYRALAIGDTPPLSTSPNFGQRRLDTVDRFLNLWICFNSILRENYGEDVSDSDLINYAISDDRWWDRFSRVDSAELRRHLKALKEFSPIRDMKNPRHLVFLNDECFEELIPFIYQVRNNLFHGRKNPEDVELRDKERIELSFYLLSPLIVSYLAEGGLIRTKFQRDFEYEWTKDGIWFEF